MNELVTIRDHLRYAVSQFSAAKLAHGHGATSALDEAAFIILEALHLPVGDINPWLEAKLLPAEKLRIQELVQARISSRKPAAYLLNKTYMHGVPFYVDERVIVPRSYIGELMVNGMLGPDGAPLIENPDDVKSVLDLCTGSACLAILAAQLFRNAEIHATELSKDALEVARINLRDHEMEKRITLHQGDLFAPVTKHKFDLIIANPPYVAKAEVDAFPPEYRAEPQMAHLGGADGFDLVRRIIEEAPKYLNKGGTLICEIGTGAEIIEKEFPKHQFFWLDTEESVSEVFLLRT
jgi:ribosomal protein L3 glutamine methyltransferase